MDDAFINKYERLIGRKLTQEEILRLQRVKDTLGLRDDDALWDVLIAIDWQRTYYEEIPQKIGEVSNELLKNLRESAELEVKKSRAELSQAVIKEAQKLSGKMTLVNQLYAATAAILGLFLACAAAMLIGYNLGSGQTHPPALLMKMPVGLLVGCVALGCGIFNGYLAAREYADGGSSIKKYMLTGVLCLILGAATLSISL